MIPPFGIMSWNEACEMPLHRDIFWIGRQWAVTGFGMQAVNQKHEGRFDIPVERLWDENLLDAVREQKWFNPDDFAKGLALAQSRFPKPPPRPVPPPTPLPPPSAHSAVVASIPSAALPAAEAAAVVAKDAQASPPPPPSFAPIRVGGHPARLLRVWRVRRQV